MDDESEDKWPRWEDLSREHQWLLERLWGGGTIRGQDKAVAIGLQRMGYLLDDKIAPAGISLCENAFRTMMKRMPLRRSDSKNEDSPDDQATGSKSVSEATTSELEVLAKIARGEAF